MKTRTISTDHPQAIPQAQEIIKDGGIVAFPTDTVYGIGVSALDNQAILRLFRVKRRSQEKAIPILAADFEDVGMLTRHLNPPTRKLMEAFWPGPLTLVLEGKEDLPPALSPDPTVGVRIPDHTLARELLRATGPLATSSANLSGMESAQTARAVMLQLEGQIELILDGGETPGEQASTVVDCTSEPPRVLRQGPISGQEIMNRWQDNG